MSSQNTQNKEVEVGGQDEGRLVSVKENEKVIDKNLKRSIGSFCMHF